MSPLLFFLTLGAADVDWLVATPRATSSVTKQCWPEYATPTSGTPCGLELANGLTSRRFIMSLDGKPMPFGTIDWLINATVEHGGLHSMYRAVTSEAQVRISGHDYEVGGLHSTSSFRAYCNRSVFLDELAPGPANASSTFLYQKHRIGVPKAPFPWTPGTRGSSPDISWPPKGVALEVDLVASALPQLLLTLHYELYDGIPLLSKWLEINHNPMAATDYVVEKVRVELFAAVAPFGAYESHGSLAPGANFDGASSAGTVAERPLLHAKTDQAHGASCEWVDDYPNSADPVPGCANCKDEGAVEPLLNCTYQTGPSAHVNPNESFVSFRALLLATDSSELERHTLARHRLTRTLAPHTTENPIFFHATDVSDAGFKRAIDQMVEVGFEMLIFSFGSGFKLETADPTYLATIKGQVAYAKSKGIEVGGYDLICLDRGHGGYGGNVGDQWCAVDGATGALTEDACFASGWYDKLHGLIDNFINETGLAMLETDGPYGGRPCAATNHAHHHGLEDSVYRQTQLQSQFYHEMRKRNVYVNQPDNFFFQGGSRTGMGYSENQYSLPRWKDLSISRAGLYDDLYIHLPTQGWMFLPLSPYHAGGAVATFAGHQTAYEFALATYLGAGTAACYRGPTLYAEGPQGDPMKAILTKWVSFYKKHRRTLIEPIVHLKRPDMQSWDGWLHVRPAAVMGNGGGDGSGDGGSPGSSGSSSKLAASRVAAPKEAVAAGPVEVGVAMLFNPTERTIDELIRLPLYYAGVEGQTVELSVNEGPFVSHPVGRGYDVRIPLKMAPKSATTIVVRKAAP